MNPVTLTAALEARKNAIGALWLSSCRANPPGSDVYAMLQAAYGDASRRYYRAWVHLQNGV